MLVSPRTIIPRCAGQTRGPCSPKRARSKMGYPANRIGHTRTFRGGPGRFPGIARPPGHRLTPDRFHLLRKSSLCIANNFLGTSHFSNFLKLWKKVHLCPIRTSREDSDRKEAPQAPESTFTRCARSFLTFPYLPQKVSIIEKNANWKIRKNSSGHKPNPAFSDRK